MESSMQEYLNMYDLSSSITNETRLSNCDHHNHHNHHRGGRRQVKQGTNKRNARERNRVRFINNCFDSLRDLLPQEEITTNVDSLSLSSASSTSSSSSSCTHQQRKLSKVETLKQAIEYIKLLTELLQHDNCAHENTILMMNYDNEHFNDYNYSPQSQSSCESHYSPNHQPHHHTQHQHQQTFYF